MARSRGGDDLYMITGGGANTLVRVTPDGVIVVDTKNPGADNYNRVIEEIFGDKH